MISFNKLIVARKSKDNAKQQCLNNVFTLFHNVEKQWLLV
jgi:hypothetical protein